jgi:hypothetical protein
MKSIATYKNLDDQTNINSESIKQNDKIVIDHCKVF